jgi:hypothetical protein
MCNDITAERELISHLTPLVGNEDATNMVNNYKKEVIKKFAKKLQSKVYDNDLGYNFHLYEDLSRWINAMVWDEVK